jgi:hypothetical protein
MAGAECPLFTRVFVLAQEMQQAVRRRKMSTHRMITLLAIAGGLATAQTTPRKAVFVGGGDPNRGKCTIEVVVDASAEIEIRGDSATLRNTGGQTPQWRRFECTGPMPANPQDFRFAGVDGRGRQVLVRDPRNNRGVAVVDIQDNQGGAEAYTFDLFWGNGPGEGSGFREDRSFEGPDRRPFDRGGFPDRRMTEDEALQVCRQSIRDQAADRFRTPNIDIRNISIDNNPGRRDWITGDLAVRQRFGRQHFYRFSCSVNFDTGAVRSAHIDQFEQGYYH